MTRTCTPLTDAQISQLASKVAMHLYRADHCPHGECCNTCEEIAEEIIRMVLEAIART